MVALLFTAVFIIGLLALALYFWVPRPKDSQESLLPPPEPPRGFIGDHASSEFGLLPAPDISSELAAQRVSLRERANTDDKNTLNEAHALGDRKFYSELLDHFIAGAGQPAKLFSLVSHVTRHELPVTNALAEAFIKSWQNSPSRSSTATSLHMAALTDDAKLYQSTVETALSLWRQGRLPEVSAAELKSVFDGEFWVLSAHTRSSGAGFVMKRSLASARRELESAARAS
jgi:hypothetical protein